MARSIDTQQSAVRGFVPAQNDEERFLMRHVEDLARAAFGRGIARYSAFLSDREQQLAQAALNRAGAPEESCRFEGGWPGAERRVLCLDQAGNLIGETYSRASDGKYRFDLLWLNRRYMLVAQDDPAFGPADYNAVAADYQLPTPYAPGEGVGLV